MHRSAGLAAVVLAIAIAGFDRASAAELTATPGPAPTVEISGLIEDGDYGRFLSVTAGWADATIVLTGTGGLYADAMAIGRDISARGFATEVRPGVECFSACALIWIAGAPRLLSASSRIGFSDTYVEFDGLIRRMGLRGAEAAEYLAGLGLSQSAVDFIARPPPDAITTLTPMLARAIGIEVVELGDDGMIRPEQAPVFDDLVVTAATFRNIVETCPPALDFDLPLARNHATTAFTEGAEIIGEQVFSAIVDSWLEARTVEAFVVHPLRFCVADLRHGAAIDRALLPDGPSFDCDNPRGEAEFTVCAEAQLSAADRLIASLLDNWVTVLTADQQERRERLQRFWLADRNACGGDIECLATAYDTRIEALLE